MRPNASLSVMAAVLAVGLLTAVTAVAQPSINTGGVVNAASYAPPGLPNSAIAQGSIFVIFGRNLGPSSLVQATFPLRTVLAGTSVRVTVGGRSVDCYLIYTSATQVAALLPSSTPVGTGTVTVSYNNQTSAPAAITVAASSFGIFTVNQAGSGPGVITDANYQVNLITYSARPGQVMVLWGTGLGPVTFDETQGAPVRDMRSVDLQVLVGGKQASILFAGRAPGFAGLDQINFTVPAGVEGCYVPVVVQTRDVVSNFATMAISASGGTCSDPASFSAQDINTAIGAGKDTRIGYITLNRMEVLMPAGSPLPSYRMDTGVGSFNKYDYRQIIGSPGTMFGTTIGQCVVFTFRGQQFDVTADPVHPQPLDAGPLLELVGPRGSKIIRRERPGYYWAELGGGMPVTGSPAPAFLEPGSYTVSNGSGGADVGPFQARLTVAAPLTLDQGSVPDIIRRNQNMVVRWTGGSADELALISGTSTTGNPPVGTFFVCAERAPAHSFTVPSYLLASMPASGPQGGVFMLGSAPSLAPYKFTAPGLDLGYFRYTTWFVKMVTYQ